MKKQFATIVICLSIMLMFCASAFAQSLSVACAANFTGAMKDLVKLYEKNTGTDVTCAFGSTGMLYGQIKNGAPYDVFFAADQKRPALLFKEGLSIEPSTYAKGKLVLWSKSAKIENIATWKDVITSSELTKVGTANPKTAPYGKRSIEALTAAGLLDKAESKIAYGKNVAQSFLYAYSGSTDASFVALSQALSPKGKEGKYWSIAEAGPVTQDVCILKAGKQDAAAAFLTWLKTDEAKTIITSYGYE
ncbi:molybdate ABC transporter substrate-binding protein [Maridesulfovibrio bastinii]|uniref:molybdate ABC transporter substrate-binding protein n=1 Tax=Maridesulfovibrio bastinii TaxID=47157 RepID=UPI0004108CB4|nr:molybdate ABC transporter substrate-binding protein [Maridesulfovibrio bastinii]